MNKIEHIGIAVKDLNASIKLFERLLGKPCYKTEEVVSEGVTTAFFELGPNKIELLEATSDNSAIAKFLAKKGEGVHHVAFAVEDLQAEIDRLLTEEFVLLSGFPKDGADNKRVAFLHPKGTNGVLVELCEEKKV